MEYILRAPAMNNIKSSAKQQWWPRVSIIYIRIMQSLQHVNQFIECIETNIEIEIEYGKLQTKNKQIYDQDFTSPLNN